MAGLVPAIHADPSPLASARKLRVFSQLLRRSCCGATWMAGTSPAMTTVGDYGRRYCHIFTRGPPAAGQRRHAALRAAARRPTLVRARRPYRRRRAKSRRPFKRRRRGGDGRASGRTGAGGARSARLRRRAGVVHRRQGQRPRRHRLAYLFWECTLRCNLECRHCGSDCLRDASTRAARTAGRSGLPGALRHRPPLRPARRHLRHHRRRAADPPRHRDGRRPRRGAGLRLGRHHQCDVAEAGAPGLAQGRRLAHDLGQPRRIGEGARRAAPPRRRVPHGERGDPRG